MIGFINVWDERTQSYVPMPALQGRGIQSFGYDVEQDRWIVVYTDGETVPIQGPTLSDNTGSSTDVVEVLTVNVSNNAGTVSADKTYAEIQTAAQAGKVVQARYNGSTYMLGYADPTDTYVDFYHMWGQYMMYVTINGDNTATAGVLKLAFG